MNGGEQINRHALAIILLPAYRVSDNYIQMGRDTNCPACSVPLEAGDKELEKEIEVGNTFICIKD